MIRLARLFTVLCVLLLPACDSPTGQAVPVCEPGVTLSVDLRTPPIFSWSPDCRVTVLSLGGPGIFWSLFASDNALEGPVTYGVTPPTAFELGLANPLETGVEYTVVLERTIAPIAFDTVAVLRFTP